MTNAPLLPVMGLCAGVLFGTAERDQVPARSTTPGTGGLIAGRVTQRNTGGPVAGAEVRLRTASVQIAFEPPAS